MNNTEIAIIGTGRFGQFWARHLSEFCTISCYDTNQENLIKAEKYARPESLKSCLTKPYIFLTIPIHSIPGFLSENRENFVPETVIIDCASVKTPVLKWFSEHIPEKVFFAASHPLFGPDSAGEGLDQHLITLIPGHIPFTRYRFLVDLFDTKLNLTVLNMTAEEHDRMMAYNLSLMHHIGRTFDQMHISRIPLMMDNMKKISDISEVVMRDSDELFTDFYRLNPFAQAIRDEFLDSFHQVEKKLITE